VPPLYGIADRKNVADYSAQACFATAAQLSVLSGHFVHLAAPVSGSLGRSRRWSLEIQSLSQITPMKSCDPEPTLALLRQTSNLIW
jgi:hypothetical protein